MIFSEVIERISILAAHDFAPRVRELRLLR